MKNPLQSSVLLGDIGGTKTLLQLLVMDGGSHRVVHEQRFECERYRSFIELLDEFFRMELPQPFPRRACFGVAGPVSRNHVRVTNLSWEIDATEVAQRFDFEEVTLLNDYEAIAHGIDGLSAEQTQSLQAGRAVPDAPRLVVGVGTGLGAAFMVWHGHGYRIVPAEVGRTGFAPYNAQQAQLWRYLRARYGRATYRMILSGSGLQNLYEFLRDSGAGTQSNAMREALRGGDPAPHIVRLGLSGEDHLASQALDLFVSIFGAKAGDLALTVLARNGVYLAGGIAPKILPRLQSGGFLTAFADRETFSEILANIPVLVVLSEQAGVLGAARVATATPAGASGHGL